MSSSPAQSDWQTLDSYRSSTLEKISHLEMSVPGQQPLAVLGEDCHIPDRRIHRQSDEPAEEHIVLPLHHRLT